MSNAIVLSEERYNEMRDTYDRICTDCTEVETLDEFVEKFCGEDGKWQTEDYDEENGILTIDVDGDRYTVEGDDVWGLEVSHVVTIIDPIMRSDVEITLPLWDER